MKCFFAYSCEIINYKINNIKFLQIPQMRCKLPTNYLNSDKKITQKRKHNQNKHLPTQQKTIPSTSLVHHQHPPVRFHETITGQSPKTNKKMQGKKSHATMPNAQQRPNDNTLQTILRKQAAVAQTVPQQTRVERRTKNPNDIFPRTAASSECPSTTPLPEWGITGRGEGRCKGADDNKLLEREMVGGGGVRWEGWFCK